MDVSKTQETAAAAFDLAFPENGKKINWDGVNGEVYISENPSLNEGFAIRPIFLANAKFRLQGLDETGRKQAIDECIAKLRLASESNK